MTLKGFAAKILRLSSAKVTWIQLARREKELHVGVKPYKNGCRCPECGKRGKIVRFLPVRRWRDIVLSGLVVYLQYAPKEIRCSQHGRVQEEIPWAEAYARVSYRLELSILIFAQKMSQKSAAEVLKIAPSSFSDILHRTVTRERAGHRIRDLKTLGVDEISYQKGKKYATIVYDLDRACVVWVGKGKAKETLNEFFENQLSEYQRSRIEWACCDLARAYTNSILEYCPNATLVIDRFHIVKALNEAVDEVRKQSWREASREDRKVLRGIRWLIAARPDTRTKSQTRKLNLLEKYNKRIFRAWILKDQFEAIWSYVSKGHARNFLNSWIYRAMRSKLEPIKEFARMLKRYRENILSFIENPITNAKAEGINRILRLVKNRSSGFKNLESFTDIILLVAGDVDIPGQFSKEHFTV